MLTDGVNPLVHERIMYDAYGVPKLRLGADLNGDGAVNFFDLSAYQTMYNAQVYGGEGTLSDANTASGPDNIIGYAGYHWDAELGMWLSRHRVYDPELGRWLQRDPAGYIDGNRRKPCLQTL